MKKIFDGLLRFFWLARKFNRGDCLQNCELDYLCRFTNINFCLGLGSTES